MTEQIHAPTIHPSTAPSQDGAPLVPVLSTTLHDSPQGSLEWFQARLGRVTGSMAKVVVPLRDLLPDSKGKDTATGRASLLAQLVAERLSGQPTRQDWGYTDAMDHGTNTEEAAIDAYAAATGLTPKRVGFLAANELAVGCSLDAVAAERADGTILGILEVKCPATATHLAYRKGGVPNAYLRQVLHNLWVTGADWCDFVSYDPALPGKLALHIVRLTRAEAEEMLRVYAQGVLAFLETVDAEEAALRAEA